MEVRNELQKGTYIYIEVASRCMPKSNGTYHMKCQVLKLKMGKKKIGKEKEKRKKKRGLHEWDLVK